MLPRLNSLVLITCFLSFSFFFFGCPTCFRAFEQFTTLIYIYAYFPCVHVACEYFLFAFLVYAFVLH